MRGRTAAPKEIEYPVAIYRSPTSGAKMLGVVFPIGAGVPSATQSGEDKAQDQVNLLLGAGVEGGNMALSVPKSAVELVPGVTVKSHELVPHVTPAASSEMSPDAAEKTPFPPHASADSRAAQQGGLAMSSTAPSAATLSAHNAASPPPNVLSPPALLQRLIAAPVESLVSWHVPAATWVVVAIGVFVAALRALQARFLFQQYAAAFPRYVEVRTVEPLIALLEVTVVLIALGTCTDVLHRRGGGTDESVRSPLWLWKAILVSSTVLVVATEGVHRDWGERSATPNRLARIASALYPVTPTLDDSLLYAVVTASLLNKVWSWFAAR